MKLSALIDRFGGDLSFKKGAYLEVSSPQNFEICAEDMKFENDYIKIDAFNFWPYNFHSEYIKKLESGIIVKMIIKKADYSNNLFVTIVIESAKRKNLGEFYLTKNSKWKKQPEDGFLPNDAFLIPIDFKLEKLISKQIDIQIEEHQPLRKSIPNH